MARAPEARLLEAAEKLFRALATPREWVPGVFDYLYDWFSEPDFRGCAFINSFREMGGVFESIADIARGNKQDLRQHLGELVASADHFPSLADQLVVLANGAMAWAGIPGSPEPALHAKDAATGLLLDSAITNRR